MIVSRRLLRLVVNFARPDPSAGRSLWSDARGRFLSNRAAAASVAVLALIILFSVLGPSLSAWTNDEIDWSVLGQVREKGAPSLGTGHYFGTDELGRDLFVRVAEGTRVSLAVGIVGALISVVVGTAYGTVAGYCGGRIDNLMMRTVDVLMALPNIFLVILLMVAFGHSLTLLFVGIGMISWLDMSRIVRGQTLALKSATFVEAAAATGVGTGAIMVRHILPNLVGVVAVYATLLVPGMILAESFISFLGLGVQEPNTSWGALIAEGAATMQYGTLWQLAAPLLFFVVTLFCFYFIGDGLRDALDPKDQA